MKKKRKLGLAFVDEVSKVNQKLPHAKSGIYDNNWEELMIPNYKDQRIDQITIWRVLGVGILFLVCLFGLFLRLFHLQVIEGDKNRQLADYNRIQIRVIHAPRGIIYDRNNKILAENTPGFRLDGKFISRDEAFKLEAQKDPSYSRLEIDTIRRYPTSFLTAHLVGYVGEISAQELKDLESDNYQAGDWIGRDGIEKTYESYLKGKDGAEIIEVDASGKKLNTIRRVDPMPGHNIYLSIDTDLQRIVTENLTKSIKTIGVCCGAAVAEDPQSGEILALVSYPSFDNNAFTAPNRNIEISSFFQDAKSPLLNRVLGGTYPPGSTFKITTSLAGLSLGKITKDTVFEDTGVISISGYQYTNWYFTSAGKTDGWVDIVKGLQRSNDIFFYRVGEKIGEKYLGETASKLYFGKKLGIDLPGEVKGLVPSDAWKRENLDEVWYPGDTLHMAIGQGFLLTTPLQILGETSFVAADGVLYQPKVVSKIIDSSGTVIKNFPAKPLVKDIFKKEDINLIKKGLSLVTKTGGTAWPFFNFSIPTAGKTGTAEFGDSKEKTHAWYTSYAPETNPQIALTILIEAGGEGADDPAQIAKEVYSWYFNTNKTIN